MKIVIGSDHAGFRLKENIKAHLEAQAFEIEDLGVPEETSVDYPEIAHAVAARVAAAIDTETKVRGILACGTGIGMSIAANRTIGVRAALCHSKETARLARAHNDANILVLPGRTLSTEDARELVDIFLETPFDGGRHERRVSSIDR